MTIKEMLTDYVALTAPLGYPALLERFLLRNGKEYATTPPVGPLGTPGLCFGNAYEAALAGRGTYTEGLGYRPGLPITVHHAWLTVDGRAMDITWRDPASSSFATLLDCEYLGIEFDNATIRRHAYETGYAGGILANEMYNVELMRKIDPDLVSSILAGRRK